MSKFVWNALKLSPLLLGALLLASLLKLLKFWEQVAPNRVATTGQTCFPNQP